MITEILQQIGLSSNEAKIYEALLNLKEAGVSGISVQTNIHRRNIYDAIKRLVEKGLAFPILGEGENVYSPVDPGKLLELIKEREERLIEVLPEMQNKYEARKERHEAYIYRGIEGFKNHMRDILRTGKNVFFIGGKLVWLSPQLQTFSEHFFKEANRKNIKFCGLFDAEVKEKAENDLKYFGKQYKFLPVDCSTDSASVVFGEYVVTYADVKFKSMNKDITIFVLRDSHLAESYRRWFNLIFSVCAYNNKKDRLCENVI